MRVPRVTVRTCADVGLIGYQESYAAVKEALPTWTEPKKRFKDYVSYPKANGYQYV